MIKHAYNCATTLADSHGRVLVLREQSLEAHEELTLLEADVPFEKRRELGQHRRARRATSQLPKPRVIRARALHEPGLARLLEPRQHPALLGREGRLELGGKRPDHVPPLHVERARVVTAALRRSSRAARENERRVVILRERPQVRVPLHFALPAPLTS